MLTNLLKAPELPTWKKCMHTLRAILFTSCELWKGLLIRALLWRWCHYFMLQKLYYQFMNELVIVCTDFYFSYLFIHAIYLFTHAMHLTCLSMPYILPVYPCHISYLFTHAMHLNCLSIPCILPVHSCHASYLFSHAMHLNCLSIPCILPVYPCHAS